MNSSKDALSANVGEKAVIGHSVDDWQGAPLQSLPDALSASLRDYLAGEVIELGGYLIALGRLVRGLPRAHPMRPRVLEVIAERLRERSWRAEVEAAALVAGDMIYEARRLLERDHDPGAAATIVQERDDLTSLRAALATAGDVTPSIGEALRLIDEIAAQADAQVGPLQELVVESFARFPAVPHLSQLAEISDGWWLRSARKASGSSYLAEAAAVVEVREPTPILLAAAESSWRPGVVGCLLVDPANGRGHLGRVIVQVAPGGERRVSDNLAHVVDTVEEAYARAVAYGRRWIDHRRPLPAWESCHVALEPAELHIRAGQGRSLDLAVALAALAVHFRWEAGRVAATGELDDGLQVRAVDGLAGKLEAARGDVSLVCVLVPSPCEVDDPRLAAVPDLDAAVQRLFPIRRFYVCCGDFTRSAAAGAGWLRATPVMLAAPLDVSNVDDACNRVVEALGEPDSRPNAITQILIAGPVGLGFALGGFLSARRISMHHWIYFVQPTTQAGPGGALASNRYA